MVEANFGGECSLSVSLSLFLSLSLAQKRAEINERSKRTTTTTTTTTATTTREKELQQRLCFFCRLFVFSFWNFFRNPPKGDTQRSFSSSPFCLVSDLLLLFLLVLLLLKKRVFLPRRILLFCVSTVSFFKKLIGC